MEMDAKAIAPCVGTETRSRSKQRKKATANDLRDAIAKNDYFRACECIRQGAPADTATRHGWTALLSCVASGSVERTETLANLGVNVNYICQGGSEQSPLILAVCLDDLEMIRCLLSLGADVDLEAPSGLTALTMALKKGRIDRLASYLVDEGCARIDRTNRYGQTPLMQCISTFDLGLECARFLIRKGVQPTEELVKLAEQHRQWTIARYFKEHIFVAPEDQCVRLHGNSANDISTMWNAVIRSHDEQQILSAMRTKAIPIDHETPEGETALSFAAKYNHGKLLLQLAKLGANIDFQNVQGRTALMGACEIGCVMTTRILLHVLSADPDLLDYQPYSALMFAAQGGHREVVQLLLGSRALARQKSAYGLDAKIVALGAHQNDIVELLRAYDNDEGYVEYGLFCMVDDRLDRNKFERQEGEIDLICEQLEFKSRVTKLDVGDSTTQHVGVKESLLSLPQVDELKYSERDDEDSLWTLDRSAAKKAIEIITDNCDKVKQHRAKQALHKRRILQSCHVSVDSNIDIHLQFEKLLENIEQQDPDAENPAMLILRPVQLQMAEHLINEGNDPAKGLRYALDLLALQRQQHNHTQSEVGGHFGLAAVPTLLCIAKGTLALERYQDVDRFVQTAVQECLLLDRADGKVLLSTVEKGLSILLEGNRFDCAKQLCEKVQNVQAIALGRKSKLSRAMRERAREISKTKLEAHEKHRRRAQRQILVHIQSGAEAWHMRLYARSTFVELTSDQDVGWPLFRSYAMRMQRHQLVYFCSAVRRLREMAGQGLHCCEACDWKCPTAEISIDPPFTCKFCPGHPYLIDLVKPETMKVYNMFLRTRILGCIPEIMRENIRASLAIGPECFDPALDAVVDNLHQNIYPYFLKDRWRKRAAFRYVAEHFMMRDPRVAICIIRLQRWIRKYYRISAHPKLGLSSKEQTLKDVNDSVNSKSEPMSSKSLQSTFSLPSIVQ